MLISVGKLVEDGWAFTSSGTECELVHQGGAVVECNAREGCPYILKATKCQASDVRGDDSEDGKGHGVSEAGSHAGDPASGPRTICQPSSEESESHYPSDEWSQLKAKLAPNADEQNKVNMLLEKSSR